MENREPIQMPSIDQSFGATMQNLLNSNGRMIEWMQGLMQQPSDDVERWMTNMVGSMETYLCAAPREPTAEEKQWVSDYIGEFPVDVFRAFRPQVVSLDESLVSNPSFESNPSNEFLVSNESLVSNPSFESNPSNEFLVSNESLVSNVSHESNVSNEPQEQPLQSEFNEQHNLALLMQQAFADLLSDEHEQPHTESNEQPHTEHNEEHKLPINFPLLVQQTWTDMATKISRLQRDGQLDGSLVQWARDNSNALCQGVANLLQIIPGLSRSNAIQQVFASSHYNCPLDTHVIDSLVRVSKEEWTLNLEDHCPICQQPEWQDVLIRLDCGHIFDQECIVAWFQRANTCPMCRQVPQ